MRVAIDVQALGSTGGIGTYTRALLEHLPPDEMLPYRSALRGTVPGAIVAPLPARLAERLWRLTGVRLPLEPLIHADLLHGTNFLPPLTRLPTVLTIHDLSAIRQPHWHPADVVRQARLWAGAAQRARRVIAISEFTALDVVNLLGVDRRSVRVVPLAPTPLPPPDAAIRSRLGLDATPYVLAVGALEPRKNLPRLIAAFRACPEAVGHKLVLAGPPAWGAAEVHVARDGDPRVILAGAVEAPELAALHAAAAAFAYPSLFEGFGLPPLDAMAAGVPVVAGAAGSLPEVLGDAALMVDPSDTRALAAALGRILGDAPLAADLRARGLLRAASFSWRKTAEATRAVYAEALA